MAKLTLSNISNIFSAATTINANNDLIEAAIEKTLSRDGTDPNEMNDDLDMNNRRVYNLPAPSTPTDAARLSELQPVIDQLGNLDTAVQTAVAAKNTAVAAANSSAGSAAAAAASAAEAESIVTNGLKAPFLHTSWKGNTFQAIQETIDEAFALGVNSVYVSPGTYTMTTSALLMREGVEVWANPDTVVITQADGANRVVLVDFETAMAHRARLRGITINGNRSNNTINTADKFAVYVGAAQDVVIDDVTIEEYAGHGVYGTTAINLQVKNCLFQNINLFGVYIISTSTNIRNAPIIDNNRFVSVGWHAIQTIRCTDTRITRNHIVAARKSGIVVDVSGTAVTWVSGPDFSGIVPGNFLIYNGGIEAVVTAVNSDTSLTINFAFGDGTSLPAALGAADTISSLSSVSTLITENYVRGGASLGYSVLADQVNFTENDVGSMVYDNVVEACGSAGYSIQSSGTGVNINSVFRGNVAAECGLNTTAAHDDFNTGMTVSGTIDNILVENNTWISYGSAMKGLHIIAPALGEVNASNNHSKTVNRSVVGAHVIAAIVGWGTGATVSILSQTEDVIKVQIVSGSGPSASPYFAIDHRVLPTRLKEPSAQMINTTGSMFDFVVNETQTQSTFTMVGTPGASTTYTMLVRL